MSICTRRIEKMDAPLKDMTEDEKIEQMAIKMKQIANLSDDKITQLSKSLINYEVYKYRNKEERDQLSDKLGIPHFILDESFSALLAIFITSLETKQDYEKLLNKYSTKVITDDELEKIKRFSIEIKPFLQACADDIQSFKSTRIPIDELMGIRTKIINIAQFEEEFSIKDVLDKYKPNVKNYHARALITIIIGEDRKIITCYANEEDIDNMIKSLGFTKKQLEIVRINNSKKE